MADISTDIAAWSGTAGSNSPTGGTSIGTGLDDNLRAMQAAVVLALNAKGTDKASAGTVDLSATDGLFHDVTGTTTITALGTVRAGVWKVLKFEGILTLTHNATSLILPNAQSITTAVGDVAVFVSEGSGNWRLVLYTRAQGVAGGRMPQKHISGLTYANNSGDATNDLDIAAGACRDATDVVDMVLASTLVKQLDAAWAVGTNAGGLDTGSIGNSDYYIWLIKRSDTGVVDALFSLSSTAPTMPANYDYKRLIGWFKRVGATIVAFHTYEREGGGIEMNWDVPTLDVNLANTLTTARRTDAVKVPLNFSVIANLTIYAQDASANFRLWITCPDATDAAPSASLAPLTNLLQATGVAEATTQMLIRTSATGTIAARSTLATVDGYAVVTTGFLWARRN